MSQQTTPPTVDPNDPFKGAEDAMAAIAEPAAAQPTPAAPPADPAAGAPPPVPAAPQGDAPPPAAAPAGPRTWKVPVTVAGESREIEVSEEAFTNPDSEAAKALRARLQKAEDYDRPGGALDQQAERKAQQITQGNLAAMERDGVVERNPQDGRYYYTAAYRKFKEQQATPPAPAAPPVPQVDPRDAELKTIDDQIAALEKEAEDDKDETDQRKVFLQINRLGRQRSDLAADIRADKHAKAEVGRIREEQSQREAQTAEQRRVADLSRTLEATVSASLQRHAAAFTDPITGKPLAQDVIDDLRSTAYLKAVDAAQRANNPEAGFAAARTWLDSQASRRGAEIEQFRRSIPRIAPAAPAAAPTFGGGAPPPATPPAPKFNPNDPFPDRELAEFMANVRNG